jgi:hypothetical protein
MNKSSMMNGNKDTGDKKKKVANSTRCSRAVTHHSTNPARLRLTSVIGREPVHSQWYDRWRKQGALVCLLYFVCLSALSLMITVSHSTHACLRACLFQSTKMQEWCGQTKQHSSLTGTGMLQTRTDRVSWSRE